ncbi:MAG: hypothetical protein GYB20_05100 [Oceanospirillales bacterium]|nr:hypothetical protein [Oceanospirillales bacterium]MBR9887058.1 hypothetical protein [Oceanospirillales bacterium]
MSTINIDNKEFEIEALSESVKAQIISLRSCDQRMLDLQQELAIVQTARNAYANALKAELPDDEAEEE